MKSFLVEMVGMTVTCVACAVVFCGLQCVILTTQVYDSLVGSRS